VDTGSGRAAELRARIRHLAGEGLRGSPRPVREVLRRASTQVLRSLGPALEPGRAAVWVSPAVPTPDGLSLADVEKTFRSWSVNGEPVGHLDGYVADSIWRFLHTWDIVREDTGTCLELGANPYFTTYLLDQHTKLELTPANYYGQRGETTETVSFVPPGGRRRVEVSRRSHLFNVEEDEFPFAPGSFDVVLFCEMLEHLLMNPLAALRQLHRVLKANGVLVLTTPNVCRLGNVLSLVNGTNIYDPYSGFGPYGRHNREYTRHELHRLLEFAGFDVEYSVTADGHPSDATGRPHYNEVAPLVVSRRDDLGQYLFVRARATRPPREGLPSFLYRSWPEGTIVGFE
jgi:SAM-dependent methyltransferase